METNKNNNLLPPPDPEAFLYPGAAEVLRQLDEYTAHIEANFDLYYLNPDQSEESHAFIENLTGEALRADLCTTEEIDSILQSAHKVNDMIKGPRFAWKLLKNVDREKLVALNAQPGSIVDTILSDGIAYDRMAAMSGDATEYQDLFQATAYATHRPANKWRHDATSDPSQQTTPVPEAIKLLVKDRRFAGTFLDVEYAKVEGLNLLPMGNMNRHRWLEADVIRATGLPEKAVEEFMLSNDARTLRRSDDGKIIPISEGGGIDTDQWYGIIKKLTDNVRIAGADNAKRVYETFGNINFQNITPTQIVRLAKLANGDKEEIERLKSEDVRVSLTDKYDYSNAMFMQNEKIETDADTLLPFEVGQPSDFYRPFVALKKLGILPASVFLSFHGKIGTFSGGVGKGKFWIDATKTRKRGPSVLGIKQSSVDRIFSEYMQPSKQTGDREIVVVSCSQAQHRLSRTRNVIPTPVALARKASPDQRVTVTAGIDPLYIKRTDEGNLEFHGGKSEVNLPVDTYTFRAEHRLRGKLKGLLPKKIGRRAVKHITEIR